MSHDSEFSDAIRRLGDSMSRNVDEATALRKIADCVAEGKHKAAATYWNSFWTKRKRWSNKQANLGFKVHQSLLRHLGHDAESIRQGGREFRRYVRYESARHALTGLSHWNVEKSILVAIFSVGTVVGLAGLVRLGGFGNEPWAAGFLTSMAIFSAWSLWRTLCQSSEKAEQSLEDFLKGL